MHLIRNVKENSEMKDFFLFLENLAIRVRLRVINNTPVILK
jgi:hypothetical protein